MIIDIKNYQANYLSGSYQQRLCYEMVWYIGAKNIKAIFGDTQFIDMKELRDKIDNETIIIKYPTKELPSLIEGYLKGGKYIGKITSFLIYAIFICAKYNVGCVEKAAPNKEAIFEFLSDMMRIFSIDNAHNLMYKAFADVSGIEPRKTLSSVAQNVEASNVLGNQNALLGISLIMDLMGEKNSYCRAPIIFLVVANIAIKYKIGTWQNFQGHELFRDFDNFHDEEYFVTSEIITPIYQKDKKAKEFINSMLDEIETKNFTTTQISNLAIDIFSRTAPNQFEGKPNDVVMHFWQKFHIKLDYDLENSDIETTYLILNYAENIYEIYYGKINQDVSCDILPRFFLGNRTANQFFMQSIYKEIRPILFCINQLVVISTLKFITLKDQNADLSKNLIENFCTAFLTDLKTYYQWDKYSYF